MFCIHCGIEVATNARFCAGCGKTVTQPGQTPSSAARVEEAPTDQGIPSGSLLMERYRIGPQLGSGGMGIVYLAQDERRGEAVAIKVLRSLLSSDAKSIGRMVQEANLSMKLSHPNVVRVHNLEEWRSVHFLVMEYVEGETLSASIAREGRLGEEEIRRIGIDIAKGLEFAHGENVLHRDLKPGNILLDGGRRVKIADFGIARAARDSLSRLTGESASGTLHYMSPEQVLGKGDFRSDLYSLGVVLYEMASGEVPFHSGDVSYQIREVVPEPLEGVSSELNAIVLRLLAKKPEERYANARALRSALDGSEAEARKVKEREESPAREEVRKRKAAEEERLKAERREKARLEEAARQAREREAEEEKQRIATEVRANEERLRKAETLIEAGAEAESQRNFDRALEAWRKALEIAPENKERIAEGIQKVEAAKNLEPGRPGEEWVNSLGIAFVYVPAGGFQMGSPAGKGALPSNILPGRQDGELGGARDEIQHEVTLTEGYWLGKYEVTQGQWEVVMGSNPSYFEDGGNDCPVEQVSWNDVQEFIKRMNNRGDGYRYRLPTEAEWEYAARAGTTGPYGGTGHLDEMGWYAGNSGKQTHPVGTKKPNAWGLYDMHGNVSEWVSDWYGDYPSGLVTDPQGPSSGSYRVSRGGSWNYNARYCRSAIRDANDPGRRNYGLGFRLLRTNR